MQVQVRGKGVVITDALRDYADKKVNKLSKHFSALQAATVTQSISGKEHRVEVQLDGDGILLRGEDRAEDMYVAIDRVVDKLERRMSKYKATSGTTGAPTTITTRPAICPLVRTTKEITMTTMERFCAASALRSNPSLS